MNLIFMLCSLALIISCAKNKYLDRDLENPRYYEGTGVAVSDNVSVGGARDRPLAVAPQYSGGAGAAAVGLIESAISLAAYPDYYQASTISGSCLIGEDAISQVGCRHTNIDLLDSSGKLIASTATNNSGMFAFRVAKDKYYGLRLADPKFKAEEKKSLKMGDKVIFRATTTPAKS